MTLTTENILLIGSLLLFISVLTSKTSFRIGVPTLLLFLLIGMLAGSDGIGGIYFDNPKVSQFIGIVSLNFILFSGGFDTQWEEIKPILWKGISLSTLGVILTAVSVGLFVWAITDFSLYEALLLGSIVSSTDAAAVFSVLRSNKIALKGKLRPLLELESGSNDPMAYVLTISFLGLVVNQDMSFVAVIPLFFKQMLIGALAGFLFGKASKFIINKINIDIEALYPILAIALMFATFSITDLIGGNGFLAVYLSAIYLGNHELVNKKRISKMYDGLAWLVQIVLFITLGLLVFPSNILPIAGIGILISVFLILVARPVGVFLSLLPFRMKIREKMFISWVGLRGAVPIVFATYPLINGIDKANMIFNIVFFISLTSVLIQGTSLPLFSKWFHVALPWKNKRKVPVETYLQEFVKDIMVPMYSFPVKKKVMELNFPQSTIIAVIKRGNQLITPNGSTVIEADDILVVFSDNEESIHHVYECLQLESPDSD